MPHVTPTDCGPLVPLLFCLLDTDAVMAMPKAFQAKLNKLQVIQVIQVDMYIDPSLHTSQVCCVAVFQKCMSEFIVTICVFAGSD